MMERTNDKNKLNKKEKDLKEKGKDDRKDDEVIIKVGDVKSEHDEIDEIDEIDEVITAENLDVRKINRSDNNNKSAKGDGENRYELKVKSIKQCGTWDCGLACVKMVLSLYNANYGNLDTICKALEMNTSVWTIDLCYILKHYNIAHQFITYTIGVDKSYAKEPFYKEYYDDDVDRVENLFSQASSVGLKIEKKTVGISDIIKHLKSLRPVIILVNWTVVKTQNSGLSTCLWPFFRIHGRYQGHFIVLTGCSEDGKKIFYMNPQKSSRKTVSSQTLDTARKSYGTDQDIIFVTEKLHKSVLKASCGHGDK